MTNKNGCWDINPGCGTGACPDECPAFAAKTTCWKLDWINSLSEMSLSEKEYWREWIQRRCIVCQIYEEHPDEVEATLNSL